jgi:hypothetical protein
VLKRVEFSQLTNIYNSRWLIEGNQANDDLDITHEDNIPNQPHEEEVAAVEEER